MLTDQNNTYDMDTCSSAKALVREEQKTKSHNIHITADITDINNQFGL